MIISLLPPSDTHRSSFHRLQKEYKRQKNKQACSPQAPPPGDHGNSVACGQWVQFPAPASSFLSLFPGTILQKGSAPPPPAHQHTPSHLLSDAAPRLAVKGPVRPFITTSQHLGSRAVHYPIPWPADLPLHCAIVWSLRGSTQWPPPPNMFYRCVVRHGSALRLAGFVHCLGLLRRRPRRMR